MWDRSEKKCLLASMFGHGLTVVVAMLGTAFFSKSDVPERLPDIKFIPSVLVDELVSGGGGNPKLPPSDQAPAAATSVNPPPPDQVAPTPPPPEPAATPPPPAPVPPTPPPPTPEPEPEPEPEPAPAEIKPVIPKIPRDTKPKETKKPKDTPQTTRTKPEADPKKPTKPQIVISTNNIVVRDNTAAQKERDRKRQEADKKAREEAERQYQNELAAYNSRLEAHNRRTASIKGTVESLGSGFAKDGGVKVEVGGPGGVAYANYGAFVKKVYDAAWILSPTLGDEDKTTEVTVVLLRSGEVLSARISKRSGFPALDKSVEAALNRVKRVAPFPEGSKDEQRSFTIDFNLKAKRQSG